MTIREALAEGSALLKTSNIESAALDSSLLLAEVLHINRSQLLARNTDQIDDEHLQQYRQMLQRRRDGECVAYIIGKKEFRGLEFLVNADVLVPRPDTETLVEVALEKLSALGSTKQDGTPLRVLDLCTGSGAIAIALKNESPALEVWAADISLTALEIAKVNAAKLLPNNSIHFCEGNLFQALPSTAFPFDLIVSNPPYVPCAEIENLSPEVKREPRLALDGGSDGLDLIRTIIQQAPPLLNPSGMLLLEADPRQMKAIASLLQAAGFSAVQTWRDLSGNERVIVGNV